jgi:wyosine [tRNA(Phe)-imidazoG37] synthetase (radical SAM superfamily)
MDIALVPVPSRRLGRCPGISNIPPKHCSYACIYCQVGPTQVPEITRRAFYPPEAIRHQVAQRLDAVRVSSETVDCLSFVPDGEPTPGPIPGRSHHIRASIASIRQTAGADVDLIGRLLRDSAFKRVEYASETFCVRTLQHGSRKSLHQ